MIHRGLCVYIEGNEIVEEPKFTLITPLDRDDYRDLIAPVSEAVWPEFMHHDVVADRHWDDLFERFPDYQFAVLEAASGDVVGIGNSVPLAWDGEPTELPEEGWDWALIQSVADHKKGLLPRTHCAIQISIAPAYQGHGMSKHLVREMQSLSAAQGLKRLIAPVRPSLKSRYPLTSIDRYIHWQDERGLPFDPWLRVHTRLGASLVKVCHQAMRITAHVREWESWTGMHFPESGPYIVPGALVPIDIDAEKDQGVYIEPNVWMLHPIEGGK